MRGFGKGGGEDLWETWDGEGRREKGEGRREKGECTIWRIASTSSESVLFWNICQGGEGHDARLYGTITHTPLRSLIVFSGGAAIVARVLYDQSDVVVVVSSDFRLFVSAMGDF